MGVGWKHTCAPTNKPQLLSRILILVCHVLAVSGRKQLSPLSLEGESSVRSPLYASRTDLNIHKYGTTYDSASAQLLTNGGLGINPNNVEYVVKRGPNGQLKVYRVAGVKRSSKRIAQHSVATPLPPISYHPTTAVTAQHLEDQTEGKKYAFAYAVRPKNGYTPVSDDFNLSHKESRDGKVTMGEYKVLLPDGRLQVVRYTADGKTGFKADVTYEGEGSALAHSQEHSEPQHQPISATKPTAAPHQVHHAPPSAPPAFKFRTFSSSGARVHPSLSPSLHYYSEHRSGEVNSHQHLKQPIGKQHFQQPIGKQHFKNQPIENSPPNYSNYAHSPTAHPAFQKVSTAQPPLNPKQISIPSPTPQYQTFKRAILGPTVSTSQNAPFHSTANQNLPFHSTANQSPRSTPNSIYDKINYFHQTAHYAPVSWGQRAGPATNPPSIPQTKQQFQFAQPQKPSRLALSPDLHTNHHVSFLKNSNFESDDYHQQPAGNLDPTFSKNFEQTQFPAQTPRNSRLLPTELFRAGPAADYGHQEVKNLKSQNFQNTQTFENPHNFGSQLHSGEHYVLEEVEDLPPQLSYFSASPTQNSKSHQNSNFQIFPSPSPAPRKSAGIVYLETPGVGIRPTALGIQKLLAQIPHNNLPRAQTTTHPYDLGSKDYGNTVSYSPTAPTAQSPIVPPFKTVRANFKPSQQLPPEYSIQHYAEESRVVTAVANSNNTTTV